MAEVLNPTKSSAPIHAMTASGSPEDNKPRLPPTSIAIPVSSQASRSGHLNLDVFSPVNQNGSFEFDREIKSGQLYKRSRKTRQWKSFFLVLRPNLLSMYKNVSEEKLLKQINLSDLTAAAYLKDPKGRRQHMFGLFTPSRNYQFQAASDAEARTWVELIRTEARIDEEEESLIFGSPPAVHNPFASKKVLDISDTSPHRQDHDRLGSSSPEPLDTPLPPTTARNGIRIPGAHQLSAQELDYSGQDHGSYSDFSDTALYGTSNASIPQTSLQAASANTNTSASLVLRPNAPRNPSQVNAANTEAVAKNNSVSASAGNADGTKLDEERVIWQGYLLCLKSKGGVRQWKRLWVVLRPKHMAFYKTDEEYSAHLLIPFTSILSAIEIDPISRSKSHCMQIIAEDRNYRFCAPSEEALARCLGALKSQLAKRKDREKKRTGV